MNWDCIEGIWKAFKGNVKQQWDQLPDMRLEVIAGNRDQLVAWMQKTHGLSRDAAERRLSGGQQGQHDTGRAA